MLKNRPLFCQTRTTCTGIVSVPFRSQYNKLVSWIFSLTFADQSRSANSAIYLFYDGTTSLSGFVQLAHSGKWFIWIQLLMRCMKFCCFWLSFHKGIIPAPLTCTPTMPSLMTCSTFDKDKLILTDLQHCSCLNAWQSCLAEIKKLLIMVPLRRSHIVLENEHKSSLYFNKGRNALLFNSNKNAPLK